MKFGTKGTNTHKTAPVFKSPNMMAKHNSMITGKSGYGATSVQGKRHNCGTNSMMGKSGR